MISKTPPLSTKSSLDNGVQARILTQHCSVSLESTMCLMACIASVLLDSWLTMGVLDQGMCMLSLRNKDLATVHPYFIWINIQHWIFRMSEENIQKCLCWTNSILLNVRGWAEVGQSSSSLKEAQLPFCLDDVPLMRQAPVQVSKALCSAQPACPDEMELGQLKACVHTDGVAQFVTQDALLAVVGQLEQVKACRWRGKSAAGLLLADGEKTPKDTSQSVTSILERENTSTDGKNRSTDGNDKKGKCIIFY